MRERLRIVKRRLLGASPSPAAAGKRVSLTGKIAYLIPGTGISGGLAVICQHVNRLKQRGLEVVLVDTMNTGQPIDWFPNQSVEVVPLNHVEGCCEAAVATGWQTVAAVLEVRAHRKLYFVQSDETRFFDDPRLKRRIRRTYELNLETMTEARWIQRWLREEFGHEATYVPNGLDEALFFPDEPLEPKGPRMRVLLEGAICLPFKGMREAFEAIADLDCEVWCVSGAGAPEPNWRVDRFFERVPMATMRRIYSSCDVILKMSRVEGFFGPPLEMMACGGTAVVSKVSGYDEYIVHEGNALVVEPGDVQGAREAILRLMNDGDLRARLTEAGRETARQWRWEPSIDTLEQLFAKRRSHA